MCNILLYKNDIVIRATAMENYVTLIVVVFNTSTQRNQHNISAGRLSYCSNVIYILTKYL